MPRPRCVRCTRPLSHCLCALIPSLVAHTKIIILQHPDEQHHALNTARWVALGVQQAELRVGEYFPTLAEELDGVACALLFPGEHAQPVSAVTAEQRPAVLIVLDGTWRKARRLLYCNPWLSTLPRLTLPAGLHSRYRLRKAPQAGALSTVEAVVHGLNVLDTPMSFDALLRPFEALIEGQIHAMGDEVYQRNHGPFIKKEEEKA